MKNFCGPEKLRAKIARATQQPHDRYLFAHALDGVMDHLLPIKLSPNNIFCYNLFVDGFRCEKILRAQYPDSIIVEQDTLPTEVDAYDAIIDFMSLHYESDVASRLQLYHRALKKNGFFQAVVIGGEGLVAMEQLTQRAEVMLGEEPAPRFFPRHQVSDILQSLHQAKFTGIVADTDMMTITYQTIDKLLADMRAMALTNSLETLPSHFQAPKKLQAIMTSWLQQHPLPLALELELLYHHAIKLS